MSHLATSSMKTENTQFQS